MAALTLMGSLFSPDSKSGKSLFSRQQFGSILSPFWILLISPWKSLLMINLIKHAAKLTSPLPLAVPHLKRSKALCDPALVCAVRDRPMPVYRSTSESYSNSGPVAPVHIHTQVINRSFFLMQCSLFKDFRGKAWCGFFKLEVASLSWANPWLLQES